MWTEFFGENIRKFSGEFFVLFLRLRLESTLGFFGKYNKFFEGREVFGYYVKSGFLPKHKKFLRYNFFEKYMERM